MTIDSCFKIGFVQKTHGLKGEITVIFDADAPDDLGSTRTLYIGEGKQIVPYFVTAISVRGNKAFVKLEDVDSIEQAGDLVRKTLFLEKSARPKKGKGEFYDDEIVGFKVVDDQVGPLGLVTEVVQAGSNRLLLVVADKREVLIPINSPFITNLDKRKKLVIVNLPDGFLDI